MNIDTINRYNMPKAFQYCRDVLSKQNIYLLPQTNKISNNCIIKLTLKDKYFIQKIVKFNLSMWNHNAFYYYEWSYDKYSRAYLIKCGCISSQSLDQNLPLKYANLTVKVISYPETIVIMNDIHAHPQKNLKTYLSYFIYG